MDAIARAGRLLGALEAMNRDYERCSHPLLSRPSAHASGIAGGLGWSTYPDRCRLQVEHRTHPGQTGAQVAADWARALDALRAAEPGFEAEVSVVFERPAYEVERDAPVVRALHGAFARALGRPPAYAGHSAWLDAALLGAAGVPTAVFGPRGAGAHAAVEYVELDSVADCARVLAEAAAAGLGSSEISHPAHGAPTRPR